jgi:hypothetical protein
MYTRMTFNVNIINLHSTKLLYLPGFLYVGPEYERFAQPWLKGLNTMPVTWRNFVLEVSVSIWNFNLHICQLGDDFTAAPPPPAPQTVSHTRDDKMSFSFSQRDGERYNNVYWLVTCDLFAFILLGMEKVSFRLKNAADCVWTGVNWLWSGCQKLRSQLFPDMHYAGNSPADHDT